MSFINYSENYGLDNLSNKEPTSNKVVRKSLEKKDAWVLVYLCYSS